LKGKEKARETDADSDGEDGKVKITRELHVNSLTRLTEAPSTWTVPQDNTAYFLDLSECPEALDEPRKPGIPRRIDVYLRDEVCSHCLSSTLFQHFAGSGRVGWFNW
jgi:hypothetical protein